MERPDPTRVLDTSGSFCPVPIVKAAALLRAMAPEEVLLVIATDPGIASDMPAFCRATRHEYLGLDQDAGVFRAWLRKRGGP